MNVMNGCKSRIARKRRKIQWAVEDHFKEEWSWYSSTM